MKESHDIIPAHMRLLSDKAEILREAYVSGTFHPAKDQERAAVALMQANAFVETHDGSYRIPRHLKRYLDSVLRRTRSYAVGDDLTAQIEALEKLANSIERAALAGEQFTREEYAEEFDETTFEISQDIDSTLSHLRALVDSRFADVSSHDEKKAQNEHYLSRMDRIENTMSLISDAPVQTKLQSTPFLEDQEKSYRRDLRNRLPEWRAEFLEIASILREHLHNLRKIEPKARRLRQLSFFFEKNRSWVLSDAPEDAELIPRWSKKARPLDIQTHPDIREASLTQHFQAIAAAIPAVREHAGRIRKRGTLNKDAFETQEVVLPKPEWRKALDKMLDQAQTKMIYADQWRLQNNVSIQKDLWIFATLDLIEEDENNVIVARPIIEPFQKRDGNLWIREIELCRPT